QWSASSPSSKNVRCPAGPQGPFTTHRGRCVGPPWKPWLLPDGRLKLHLMCRIFPLTCALIVSLLATPVLAAAPCRQEFAFRGNPQIGLTAIRKLSQFVPEKDAPRTKNGAELVVWPFDEEDQP